MKKYLKKQTKKTFITSLHMPLSASFCACIELIHYFVYENQFASSNSKHQFYKLFQQMSAESLDTFFCPAPARTLFFIGFYTVTFK